MAIRRSTGDWLRLCVAGFTLALGTSDAKALPLVTYSEYEISRRPIVVIGYWPEVPYNENHITVRDEWVKLDPSKDYDRETKLVVTRSVFGDIGAGTYTLELVGAGWNDRRRGGNFQGDYGSMGAVENLANPCIWFLEPSHSADPDGRPRLRLSTPRGVQPSSFLEYYQALRSGNDDTALHLALNSEDPDLVRRGIYLASGWKLPWLFDAWLDLSGSRFVGPKLDAMVRIVEEWEGLVSYPQRGPNTNQDLEHEVETPISSAIGELRNLVHRASGEERVMAVAAFANLAGKAGTGSLRALLDDPQVDVRAVVAAYLVCLDDVTDVAKIAAALVSPKQHVDHDEIARAIWKSREKAFEPILFAFLGDAFKTSQNGPSLPAPAAITAERALHEYTGRWYPLGKTTDRAANPPKSN